MPSEKGFKVRAIGQTRKLLKMFPFLCFPLISNIRIVIAAAPISPSLDGLDRGVTARHPTVFAQVDHNHACSQVNLAHEPNLLRLFVIVPLIDATS